MFNSCTKSKELKFSRNPALTRVFDHSYNVFNVCIKVVGPNMGTPVVMMKSLESD